MKVGIFSILGLLLIGAVTVFVNDKPFWWRSCELIFISVEDATGLKTKSPVRSLGLQIGYLRSIELSETHVRLGICVTAPVAVGPQTRAYIRGEGFLGDKFVELKPVKYVGEGATKINAVTPPQLFMYAALWGVLEQVAVGALEARAEGEKEVPMGGAQGKDMQQLMDQVNNLVGELTGLTSSIRSAVNPQELRETMQQLNKTLENAAKTLSPEGNLTTTAQRTLSKLEDAIEQLRASLTRMNNGEGTIGKFMNDPAVYEELLQAVRNVNLLLSKVAGMRFLVDLGVERIPAYDGSRSWLKIGIWPRRDRYYLLGITVDPRGKQTIISTTTRVGNQSTTTETTQIEGGGILLTGMLGKVFWSRLDLSAGVLHGDGAISLALNLGPSGDEERIRLVNDVYARLLGTGTNAIINDRLSLVAFPFGSPYLKTVYFKGGLESFRKVDDQTAYLFGAGVSFDDQDIKMLFSLL